MAKRVASPTFCEHCMEDDHASHECALDHDAGTSVRHSEKSGARSSELHQQPSGSQSQGFIDCNSRPVCKRRNNASCKAIQSTRSVMLTPAAEEGYKATGCKERSCSRNSDDAAASRSLIGWLRSVILVFGGLRWL